MKYRIVERLLIRFKRIEKLLIKFWNSWIIE